MRTPDEDPAVAVAFMVQIGDGRNLGPFTSVEGLGFEVTTEQHEEGGNHAFVHILPGRIKYQNVKLTRPVGSDTAKVAQWVASMATVPKRATARIVAISNLQQPIVQWSLQGVFPIRWTGPQLSVDSNKVATETLELAHHGFNMAETYGFDSQGKKVS